MWRGVATQVRTHRTYGTQKIRRLRQDATPADQTQDLFLLMIADICEVRGSEKTLRKPFALLGYHRRNALKKPFLNETQKAKRLQFALPHQGWTREDWQWVIWPDEC